MKDETGVSTPRKNGMEIKKLKLGFKPENWTTGPVEKSFVVECAI